MKIIAIPSALLIMLVSLLNAELPDSSLDSRAGYSEEQPAVPVTSPDDEMRDFLGGGGEDGIYW